MPRQPKIAHQFDLFSSSLMAMTQEAPPWQSLPAETRQRLTTLMIRLILESADAGRAGGAEDGRYDQ